MRCRRGVDFAAGLWLSCNKPLVEARLQAIDRKEGTISATDPEPGEDAFMPKFDAAGLLAAVVQHAESGEVLMVAFMNSEALAKTRETGLAHFHSRSRCRLWMKGETSGHVLRVQQILVDCDQDALVLRAVPEGPACHTGARSCFFRELGDERLRRID